MIKLLHIENIAVIEKVDIEFAAGLIVLTGETGAGKSIVIDALSAVTGGRTSRDVIRTGADYASVTAVFSDTSDSERKNIEGVPPGEIFPSSMTDTKPLRSCESWFDDNGVEPDESGDIFISRKISADGKSVCRVNGAPVSATQLRELGTALLDIHGQNDGRKLLDEGAHLSYLDVFGDLEGPRDAFYASYKKLMEKKADIDRITIDEGEKERRIDAMRYQIEEIARAKLSHGEQDELTARRELLLNASNLTEAVEAAFEALYGGDRTTGAVALISEAHGQLDRAARYSDGLRVLGERLLDLRYSAQDISDELRDFRTQLDFMPGELNELETRLDVLRRITRKYGGEEEALAHLERSRTELSDIEDSTNKLAKLENELEGCVRETVGLAGELTEKRKTAAAALQIRVMDELSQLNIPGVSFLVELSAARGEYGLNATGGDEARFLMSANAGEAPGRINRIASGGELARIMLAMKNVLVDEHDTNAMVFDEIDAGVSGIAAQRVAEKLAKLARLRQVLCVTHLPQIAVMADTHFEIQKSVSNGRTFTHVNELDFEGRKKEIARLSGGENITITTLKSAAEQLDAAREFKRGLRELEIRNSGFGILGSG